MSIYWQGISLFQLPASQILKGVGGIKLMAVTITVLYKLEILYWNRNGSHFYFSSCFCSAQG